MNNDGLNKIRAMLINIGKSLPFILCAVIFVSYTETLFALETNDFVLYNGSLIPNKRLSLFLGLFFEYNLQLLFVVTILTFAIRTCIHNKMALGYNYINLAEKSYFDFELDIWQIYTIAIANLIVSGYFTYKGIRILTISQKQ